MSRPRLLWVDSTFGCPTPVPRTAAEAHFEVSARVPVSEAHAAVRHLSPAVVCFEFEHPDAASLRAMREFKVANPSLPLLMLTTHHSEALAVWAFRVRVWNYLVKPVAASELAANFAMLARIALEERGPARPVRTIGALMPPDAKAAEKMRESPLRCALRHVETNFEHKLRQSSIAASAGMSSSAFSRAFKAEFGITFSQYLARYRIGRACYLLRQGSHSVTTVGQAVGFDDASHFARTFRALLGVSPSAFKRVGSDTMPPTGVDGRPGLQAALHSNAASWLSAMTWERTEEIPA
jgi:AraC-like DNA-binding protein/ActR/RegA family two-component response regulator